VRRKKVDFKALMMDDKNKDFFKSRGITTIKKTELVEKKDAKGKVVKDEDGNPIMANEPVYYDFEIRPLGSHPLVKAFLEKNPQPKPPVKRELVNPNTGRSPLDDNVSPQEAKNSGVYKWANVYDYTDKKYLEENEKFLKQLRLVQMMIVFDLTEEFGIDKTEKFEKRLEEMGFSSHQLNKIGEDIKDLDFFTEKSD
jgi:hypothetical protein